MAERDREAYPTGWKAEPRRRLDCVRQHLASRPYDVLAFLFILFFLLGLCWLARYSRVFIAGDPVVRYIPAAQAIRDGALWGLLRGDRLRALNDIATDRKQGPWYPMMLALVSMITVGDLFLAAKIVGILSSTAFVGICYLVVRKTFGSKMALLCILTVILAYPFVYESLRILADVPFAALASLSLYCLLGDGSPTRNQMVWAGIFSGLAFLTRWNGMSLVPFFLVAIWARSWDDGFVKQLKAVLTYLGAFVVVVGPWLLINYLSGVSPIQANFYRFLYPTLYPPSIEQTEIRSYSSLILANPLRFVVQAAIRLVLLGPIEVIRGAIVWGPLKTPLLIASALGFAGLLYLAKWSWSRVTFVLFFVFAWLGVGLAHYEARFYILLLPLVSLSVVVFLLSLLPDVFVDLRAGQIGATYGWAPRAWSAGLIHKVTSSGVSLTVVVLVLLLLLASTDVFRSTKRRLVTAGQVLGSQVDVAQFLDSECEEGGCAAIGVPYHSGARYFIPHLAGRRVVYVSSSSGLSAALPKVSHLYFEDRQKISSYLDPLTVPETWEAIYYRSIRNRAVLYRILEEAHVVHVVDANASSSESPGGQPENAVDNNLTSFWSSTEHVTPDATEWFDVVLGRDVVFNRLWIVPKLNGWGFPQSFEIQVSKDAGSWATVVRMRNYPQPERQDPQVLALPESKARFVRIQATELGATSQERGRFAFAMVELRVSLAREKTWGFSTFDLSPKGVEWAEDMGAILVHVRNWGTKANRVHIGVQDGGTGYAGYPVGVFESPLVLAGDEAAIAVSDANLTPGLHSIHVTLNPWIIAGDSRATRAFLVTIPKRVMVDSFDYSESPLQHGWVLGGETHEGDVIEVVFDEQRNSRVLRVTSPIGTKFRVDREIGTSTRPVLSFQLRASAPFIIYAYVRATDGAKHYIVYRPGDSESRKWDGEAAEYTLPIPLDGKWYTFERDLDEDLFDVAQMHLMTLLAFKIRGGDLALDDLAVSTERSGLATPTARLTQTPTIAPTVTPDTP